MIHEHSFLQSEEIVFLFLFHSDFRLIVLQVHKVTKPIEGQLFIIEKNCIENTRG